MSQPGVRARLSSMLLVVLEAPSYPRLAYRPEAPLVSRVFAQVTGT